MYTLYTIELHDLAFSVRAQRINCSTLAAAKPLAYEVAFLPVH